MQNGDMKEKIKHITNRELLKDFPEFKENVEGSSFT
jgi:hypothetical protein